MRNAAPALVADSPFPLSFCHLIDTYPSGSKHQADTRDTGNTTHTAAAAMSSNTNPDPAATAPAFIPLEANPQLLTTLIHKLGVSPALQMHDVYSLTDPDMLAFIPRPALALLLVFPISAVYESHRMAEDSLATEYNGTGDKEPVLWWKQTIRNACGLMGLLHAVTNGPAREFISTLMSFLCRSFRLSL